MMSSAVCAISGVCSLASRVPLWVRKFSRFGICSRSDGTFGLSLLKWTLSKVNSTTWRTDPDGESRWQVERAAGSAGAAAADAAVVAPDSANAPTVAATATTAPVRLAGNQADLMLALSFERTT